MRTTGGSGPRELRHHSAVRLSQLPRTVTLPTRLREPRRAVQSARPRLLDACNSTTNRCQVGYTCYGGVCSPFCEGTTSVCTGANARCVQVTSSGTPVPGYFYCTRTCNPVNPQQEDATYDACGATVNCFPSATRDSDCVGGSTPSGTQGVNCVGTSGQGDSTRCAVGHFCRQPTAGTFQCARFCSLSRRRVRRGSHLHGIPHEALRRAERDRLLRGARGLALRLSESFASGR